MFCKKCGKEIDQDSAFCSYCGTAINGVTSESSNIEDNSELLLTRIFDKWDEITQGGSKVVEPQSDCISSVLVKLAASVMIEQDILTQDIIRTILGRNILAGRIADNTVVVEANAMACFYYGYALHVARMMATDPNYQRVRIFQKSGTIFHQLQDIKSTGSPFLEKIELMEKVKNKLFQKFYTKEPFLNKLDDSVKKIVERIWSESLWDGYMLGFIEQKLAEKYPRK